MTQILELVEKDLKADIITTLNAIKENTVTMHQKMWNLSRKRENIKKKQIGQTKHNSTLLTTNSTLECLSKVNKDLRTYTTIFTGALLIIAPTWENSERPYLRTANEHIVVYLYL